MLRSEHCCNFFAEPFFCTNQAPKTPIAVAAADAEAALARRRDMFAGMRRQVQLFCKISATICISDRRTFSLKFNIYLQGTGRTVEASGINLIGNQYDFTFDFCVSLSHVYSSFDFFSSTERH